MSDLQFPTSLGISTPDTITLLGRDLPGELLGQVSFGELAYQLITLRPPTKGQARVFETVLVALADHGFTPTAIAARLTYLSAPDAIQGALAAGLLGGGSRFLGVSEDTGAFLAEALASVDSLPDGRGRLGRTRDRGRPGPHGRWWLRSGARPPPAQVRRSAHRRDHRDRARGGSVRAAPRPVRSRGPGRAGRAGRSLPLNGAGTCGAALADIGIPLGLLRGVVLLARCAGLLGHLAEEMRHPIANDIFRTVESHAAYVDPQY